MGLGLFGFIEDMDNYKERVVDSYKENDLFVDTAAVSDSTKPFETAIAHPKYNDGKIVIVELYDTKEDAQVGHDKWLNLMLEKPPRQLSDVSTACSANLLRILDDIPPCERAAD